MHLLQNSAQAEVAHQAAQEHHLQEADNTLQEVHTADMAQAAIQAPEILTAPPELTL